MSETSVTILGIESSCDDTAVAVMRNGVLLSNIVCRQEVHEQYGGVIPELASRAHQQNIVPTVDTALKRAGVEKSEISAVAYTRGPGLLGSLLVGTSFAKGMALSLNVPLIEVNHMQAHILAHFIDPENQPEFPFLCLTVSGGHTQIVLVRDFFDMEVLGETIDDAAGEAFDKAAKVLGLPYPGGPLVDKAAAQGNPLAYKFPHPKVPNYNYSFSGLKTAFLNFVKENNAKDKNFVVTHLHDICASYQKAVIDILLSKFLVAAKEHNIRSLAISGGVSANSGLRNALLELQKNNAYSVFIPKFEYCTDNAAMIAVTGYLKYKKNEFAEGASAPMARWKF